MTPRPSPYPRREPRPRREPQVVPDLMGLAALGDAELRALIDAAELAARWVGAPDVLGALERGRNALELELLDR